MPQTSRITRRSLLVSAAFAAAAVPARLAAAAPDAVTMGPGLMTLPEIAAALSTPERPVRCAGGLRRRAAFVHLKGRPRADAERLLCAALGLTVAPRTVGKATALYLDADPEVERREARWRRRLLSNLQNAVRQGAARHAALLSRPRAGLEAEAERLEQEWTRLRDSPDPTDKSRAMRAMHDYYTHRYALLPETDDAPSRLGRHWLTRYAGALRAEDALRDGCVVALLPAATLGPAEVRAAIEDDPRPGGAVARKNPDAYDILAGSLTLERGPDQLRLSYGLVLAAAAEPGRVYCPTRGAYVVLPAGESPRPEAPPPLADEVFGGSDAGPLPVAGLGDEAKEWRESERAATAAFLEAEHRRAPADTKPATAASPGAPTDETPVDCLSAVVARWCRATGREAIMELFPDVEALGRPRPASQPDGGVARITLDAFFAPEGHWTLRERDGVLFVENQLAFLDRARAIPTAALAVLARGMAPRWLRPAGQPTILPPRPTAEEFAAYLAAGGAGSPYSNLAGNFWGVRLSGLEDLLPGALLWSRMSPGQRERLAAEKRLPLSEFPETTLREVAALLRRRGPEAAQLWLPGAMAMLRRCTLNQHYALKAGDSGLSAPGL